MDLYGFEHIDLRELELSREGGKGKQVWSVSSGRPDVAAFGNAGGVAVELPKIGDSWDSVNAPYLVCVRIRFKREGGSDTDKINVTGGWTQATCEFETLGLHGSLPPPSAGISFTKPAPSVTSVQAIYGINPDTGQVTPGDVQLADGQGAPRDVGILAYEVYKPLSPNDFNALDVPRLVELHTHQAVNDEPVTLPAYLASTRRDQFGRDQLRFAGFSVDDPDERGWRYVRYNLAAALDHQFRWTAQAEGGDASPSNYARHQYRRLSFSGLF